VTASDRQTANVAWLPIDENDGWVVYRPDREWIQNDTVVMSVGARTVSGQVLGPISYTFSVVSGALAADPRVPQPSYADLDTSEIDLTAEASDLVALHVVEAPALDNASGPAYATGEQQAYPIPQRVWLPVPEGTDATQLNLYYLHDGSWYPAERVIGWLVPDSDLHVEVNGIAYVGVLVRHAGVVQLGIAQQKTPTPAQAGIIGTNRGLNHAAGDVVLAAAMIGLLATLGRKRKTIH
jgi:hypothetical protein